MNKTEDLINAEKDHYGKIYVDVTYAIDNIRPFLEADVLKSRKYTVKLTVLKKYIDLLNSAEADYKKGGFFSRLNSDKYTNILSEYKNDNSDNFTQLKNCSSCACLNCTAECKFDSCSGCREGSHIQNCDHKKINITLHDTFFLNLTNDRTGEDDRYKVLATLQDAELDKKYIITQNIGTDEKFILYYYPGIVEDTYGEISDAEEFDFIAGIFQSVNL